MIRHVLNYINGVWERGEHDSEPYYTYNPSTEETVAQVTRSGLHDVGVACEAADSAYERWRRVPAPIRGEWLQRVGDILKERKAALARLITLEIGKTKVEAEGEVQEAIDMAYYMAAEGRRLGGQVVPSELSSKWALAIREPLGVCVAISAYNFPIAVPSWKIFPALILGNTIVWKPAVEAAAVSSAFVRCFADAGIPNGVINLLVGGNAEVGSAMVRHPQTRVVSFTGSTEAGRKVNIEAAEHLKRTSLELGGKNACIVLADSALEQAAEAITWSAFGTTGQRCTSTSRVIVESSIVEPLMRRLVDHASSLVVGDPLDPKTEVGPLISDGAVQRMERYIDLAKSQGIEIHCGGHRLDRPGHFFAPTIIGPVSPDSLFAQEELFGPILTVIEARDMTEAIEMNNATPYGLSAAIFTQDINQALHATREIDAGIVYVNQGTTGAEIHLPFGGTKHSGNGTREAGQAALDVFSEWKSIYIDYSGKLQRAQIDTSNR